MKVVPFPSVLSKVTVPPNPSVIRLTTGKPKPCPLDFVVNKGVNSLVAILVFPTSDSQEPVQLIHQYIIALTFKID